MTSMAKFIPREKLGKKARRALDAQRRAAWDFSPVTRKVESRKIYNRKEQPSVRYDPDRGLAFGVHEAPPDIVEQSCGSGYRAGILYVQQSGRSAWR